MCKNDLAIHIRSRAMRTNIEIDDELLAAAIKASGVSTKRAAVEQGLKLLVKLRRQVEALADIEGLGWDGDLDAMRRARPSARP